jgi:hypothetical protein
VNDAKDCGPVSSGDIYIGNVAIGELEERVMATIYPNPTQGSIRVVLEGGTGELLHLEIINMSGKIIHQEDVQTSFNSRVIRELDISDQPKGIYLMRIAGENIAQSEKIILK